ncbi:MAG: IS5/IS1182 family transposase, partial [Cyanobacteria bacterium SW_12_48_29]
HLASKTPHQNTKKKPLTRQDKEANSQLASVRVRVEHVITSLKIFRILLSRYRNRRKQFGCESICLPGFKTMS